MRMITFGLSLFCLLLTFQPLSATSLIQTDEENVRKADLICAIKVEQEGHEKRDGANLVIFTVSTLECFKGLARKTFEIELPNRSQTRGAPSLKIGQAAIVYLDHDEKSGLYRISNWIQGVLPLEQNSATQTYQIPAKVVSRPKIPKNGNHQALAGPKLSDYRVFVDQFLKK